MVSVQRVIAELDGHLARNDYAAAEKHLLFWLDEAVFERNSRAKIPILNELIGLYRKLGRQEDCLKYAALALDEINAAGLEGTVTAATTYINTATAYKAFSMAEQGFSFFERAKEIYERELDPTDSRLGGLYNNMALSLADMKRYDEANGLYGRALEVMKKAERGNLEMAITYLNIATMTEQRVGLLEGSEEIEKLIETAQELLDISKDDSDGYYAFVCEKCATVFGYYGFFAYQAELQKRAGRIYEGT